MTTFNENFAAGGSDITVGSVEHRRHAARALATFRVAQGAALDLGASKREATLAAARAVREIHGLDLLAALGLAPEGAQGAAGLTGGQTGDDGRGDGERPEADEAAGDAPQPPRSRDPRRLFVDLIDAELGPSGEGFDPAASDAFTNLVRIIDGQLAAAPGPEYLNPAGGLPRMPGFLMEAMAREPRFSAAGWSDNPERDHDHGFRRLAMLTPEFVGAVEDIEGLVAASGYGVRGLTPANTKFPVRNPAGIAVAVILGLDRGPDGVFRVPGAPARRGLRAI